MAHCSELKDESDVSKVMVPQGYRNDGFFVKNDLYVELEGANRMRSLFDQVLSYFLKGVSENKDVIRGFSPKLGNGVEADLFTLFWVVRKMGDYELVSKNEMWEFVAEQCGLDVIHVSSLKLIYNKYLKELDQWLSHGGFKDTKLEKGELGVLEKLGSLFHELKGCKYSLSNVEFENGKGKCVIESTDDKGVERSDLDMEKAKLGFPRIKNVDEKDEEFGKMDERIEDSSHGIVVKKVDISKIDDENNDASKNDNNTMMFAKMIVKNVVSSRKRKKEESLAFLKMLDWVENAARNPHDVAIGSIPNCSNWKKYNSNEVWKQVLLVKDSLFAKRNVDTRNKVYGSQKKRHIMHPSMYENDKTPIYSSSKRIRCSQRVSPIKSCSCPGCSSSSSSQSKRQKPDVKKSLQILETAEKHDSKKRLQILETAEKRNSRKSMQILDNDSKIQKVQDDICKDVETDMVTVGAEVPEWTGVVSESDPKWLGTRMWPPPENINSKKHKGDMVVIGKGRQRWCRCSFPGSADCVKFHISKKRTRVRRMLGPVFNKWKFNDMGEEASCSSWSLEEETEFKSLVIKARQELTHKSKSRHEIMTNFWRRASKSIPLKTKDALVRYYFNVFVLRRRSYQNRIMPENIDSDDDEQEVE